MIYGCGVDIEEIIRFEKYNLAPFSSGFLSKIYTQKELENYSSYKKLFTTCLALGFSCKEAFFKAFNMNVKDYDFKDIELIFLSDPANHKISINFYAYAKSLMKNNKISLESATYFFNESFVKFDCILTK